MTCPHYELTNNGFDHYSYCVRCKLRIHIVMTGQFSYNRFIECLEKHKYPKALFAFEAECNCHKLVKLNEGELRIT